MTSLVPKLQLGNRCCLANPRRPSVPKLKLGNQVEITFLSVNKPLPTNR